jgi:drug/metabolite transporter (DMT)-like permease
LLHVAWNAVVKVSRDRLVTMTQVAGSAAIVSLVVLVFVPFPNRESWMYLLLSAAVHSGYVLFLLRAYEHGDLSQVYPIARGTAPLLVLGLAFLAAGEVPHGTALAAILLIVAGVVSLAFRGRLRLPRDHGQVRYAFLTAIFIALYTVIDGLGARRAGTPHGYTASLFVLNGLVLAALLSLRHGRGTRAVLRGAPWKAAAVGGIMSLAAYWLVIWALTLAPMAPVAALRETSVIFAAILGTVWLKEPFGRWSIAAAVVVAAGIVLLQV